MVYRVTGWLPLFVQISMPSRFSNLSAMMLIPLCVALIARASASRTLLTLLLLSEALLIPISYESLKHFLMFAVLGAAFGAGVQLHGRVSRQWLLPSLACLAISGALAVLWLTRGETGLLVFCASVLVTLAFAESGRVTFPPWFATSILFLTLLIVLGIPSGAAWSSRRTQRSTAYTLQPYDRKLKAWLFSYAAPADALLSPLGPPAELQAKTGHPVVMELETLYLMTYMPRLAGVIGAMARDLYGVDYASEDRFRHVTVGGRIVPGSQPLANVWKSRTSDEWRLLGRKYSFRWVLSSTGVPLHLTAVLPGPEWTLYSVF
jgi:hypothetical protein